MRVVIVGASGAVGRTAVEALAGRHEIISVGRTSGDVEMDIEDAQYKDVLERLRQNTEFFKILGNYQKGPQTVE